MRTYSVDLKKIPSKRLSDVLRSPDPKRSRGEKTSTSAKNRISKDAEKPVSVLDGMKTCQKRQLLIATTKEPCFSMPDLDDQGQYTPTHPGYNCYKVG